MIINIIKGEDFLDNIMYSCIVKSLWNGHIGANYKTIPHWVAFHNVGNSERSIPV